MSSKLFLQTRIMQFWQLCQKNCAMSQKIFRSISEKDEKKLTCLIKNLSKCCHGCVECSIENPAEKFLTKSRKVFAECPKMIIKIIPLRFVFPHNISMDTYNGVLTTLPKKIVPEALIFFAQSPKKIKKLTLFNKKLFSKCHGCVECSIDNPAEIFQAQCPKMMKKLLFSKKVSMFP